MTHNPYAPPATHVDDAVEMQRKRPWQVKAAMSLLCLSIALSTPNIVQGIIDQGSSNRSHSAYIIGTTIGLAITLALASLLFASIWNGWRWGRMLYAVVALLGATLTFNGISGWPARPTYLVVTDVLSTMADIAAVVLLFTAAGNAWFRRPPP